jgi:hypothetical protein
MKKSFLGLLFGIVFFFGNIHVVKSENYPIKDGYITGNDYFNIIIQPDNYLMGIVDGMMLGPIFGASKDKRK